MGQTTFTAAQASRIRALLDEKCRSSRAVQKRVRNEIRRIGFYISRFRLTADGFTSGDFDQLVKDRAVVIR